MPIWKGIGGGTNEYKWLQVHHIYSAECGTQRWNLISAEKCVAAK